MRIRLGLLSVWVLLVGGALSSPGALATPARSAASPPACATRGLAIWLNTQGSGAAGSSFYNVELTNLSGRACTLSGYPRVVAVDLAGRSLGSGSQRFVSAKPTVRLAQGATASFALQIAEVGNYPAAVCRRVTAAGLRVFPPGQGSSKVVPFPFPACSRSGPVFLAAQAVQGHS